MTAIPLFASITPETSVETVTGSGIVQLIANVTFFFGVLLALAGVVMVIMKLINGKAFEALKVGFGVLLAAALLMNLEWSLSLLQIVVNLMGTLVDSIGGLFGSSGGSASGGGATQ